MYVSSCVEIVVINRRFLQLQEKLLKGGENWNQAVHIAKSFDQRRWGAASFCSSLSEATLKCLLTGFQFLKKQLGHSIMAHVSDDNSCKPQNATGCDHDHLLSRWWHFLSLSINGNFSSLEKWRIHFFPKMSTAPLFFSVPTPYPVKFCTGVQFSHVQQLNKNTRK